MGRPLSGKYIIWRVDKINTVPDTVATEPFDSADSESSETGWNDKLEIDFTYDYTEDIEADVGYMASDLAS